MKLFPMPRPFQRRPPLRQRCRARVANLCLVPLILAALVVPSGATWSIVVVDTATGEVCVAAATCLANFDLARGLPVVRVGLGGAAAQSAVDVSGNNRQLIWDEFAAGAKPSEILQLLAASDPNHQARQYGIVTLGEGHKPTKFTGGQAGQAKKAVVGIVGSLRYAIAGNVLAGPGVVDAAEQALLASSGDLSQRVMAGMEAARALGGDGRCSCSQFFPSSCGAPPPSFTKSAHVGFVVLARMGDTDGVCGPSTGCANGSYFLDLDVIGGTASPDPVLTLQSQYASWRQALAGRPDHILSSASAAAEALPADGSTSTRVSVELVDIDGVPLGSGGAQVGVSAANGLVSAGPVTDLGNGRYFFDVVAGSRAGPESIVVVIDDGSGPVQLHPPVSLTLETPTPLFCGTSSLVSAEGGEVPFTLDLGPSAGGSIYVLLGSISGTAPGVDLGAAVLPLNPDPFTEYTLLAPGPPLLPGSLGLLDAAGRASAAFDVGPGLLAPWNGVRFDWAALALTTPPSVAGPAGFDVVP